MCAISRVCNQHWRCSCLMVWPSSYLGTWIQSLTQMPMLEQGAIVVVVVIV